MNPQAPFITIEGVDGAGKSSHIPTVVAALREAGFEVVQTNEPGGTELGLLLREQILNTAMDLQTEVLLAFASRRENLVQVIEPALASGKAVVCDRFTDSTFAYQGRAGGCPASFISYLENTVHPARQPDLTLLFDLPVEESKRRLGGTGKTPDKFEGQGHAYFERVRAGYLARQAADPGRFKIIDASPSIEEVARQVRQAVAGFLEAHGPRPARAPKP